MYYLSDNHVTSSFKVLDQLLVSAYIFCLVSVIGISVKSCIGAPLLVTLC